MTHTVPQLALTAEPHRHPQPIADLATASPGLAVTILNADAVGNAVILAPDGGRRVRIVADGQLREVHADLDAVPISDPATALALTQQSLAWAVATHHAATDRVRDLAAEIDRHRHAHGQQLAEIRSYAIARHRDGDICRDGLNAFLRHFDLDEYQPRHRVRFTITGSFDVRADVNRDTDDTEYDVREYLRLNTDQVDNVDTDTISTHITADAIEADE
ncbi:hypothetical protein ABIH81_19505 [Micromonospora sp. HUAS YX12]|uniref:Uncharacterized protein n=1 Tax=Micromonospora sp. HUAS YX12 TaxID=3156396 RepID=A0AAU7QUE2_9ACTN